MEEIKPKAAVLYHRDADGFGSAFAIWRALKDTHELMFESVQYKEDAPIEQLREFAPNDIFVVDFSYSAEKLVELSELVPSGMLFVYDHHKTSKADLDAAGLKDNIAAVHDESQAGCMITYSQMLALTGADPDQDVPEILLYVQDRDLWKFELENSKEVNAYIATLPWDFEEWDNFYLPEAYTCGRAVLAFQKNQIEARYKDVAIQRFWDGQKAYYVPTVNASDNISELGNELCKLYPDEPFSVSYCDRADGVRSYSLRSNNGFDVSAVAKYYGGGGHPAAAGFSLPSPAVIQERVL